MPLDDPVRGITTVHNGLGVTSPLYQGQLCYHVAADLSAGLHRLRLCQIKPVGCSGRSRPMKLDPVSNPARRQIRNRCRKIEGGRPGYPRAGAAYNAHQKKLERARKFGGGKRRRFFEVQASESRLTKGSTVPGHHRPHCTTRGQTAVTRQSQKNYPQKYIY